MRVRRATHLDAATIAAVLGANLGDPSLFQQPEWRIRRQINDFVVAESGEQVVGCAAVHWHRPDNVEILAVAVAPDRQGIGVGKALIAACLGLTGAEHNVWLGTKKPGYFARFGFHPVSMWSLPIRVLLTKLRLVFEQPLARWLPALYGSHFMRHCRET